MGNKRIFSRKIQLPVSAAEAFSWHKQKGAFHRLLPPWEKIKVIEYSGSIADGSQAELRCSILGPLAFSWLLEHQNYIPEKQFCDLQVAGPFSYYKHSHLFTKNNSDSELEDRIEYKLPLSPISHLFAPIVVDRRLDRTFRYRHRITSQDLKDHYSYKEKPKLSFLIGGSTGMIGSALCAFLTTGGHQVTRIVRHLRQAENDDDDVVLGPNGEINLDKSSRFDCVINLAGAGIADKRWSEARKKILIDSRVEYTKKLVSALKELSIPPKTMISASGLGYYGDVGDQYPDESSSKGLGFLADLSEAWELAASPVSEIGCRLVYVRLAAVLSAGGGALKKMQLPFSLGLGGKLGNGNQQFGWVALDDVLRAILFTAYEDTLSGVVNIVAPSKTNNAEFTKALGRTLNRPTLLPLPAILIKLIFGELAQETLLSSSNAKPNKLLTAGFSFLFNNPELAIRSSLGLPC